MVRHASREAVVSLIEVEWLVTKEAHGDESFAVVLIDFGINAKVGHAANRGIELFANLVCHEFHLLVLDAGTLGIGSQLLHVGGVLTESLVLLLAGALSAFLVAGQQTMHHEVGIATDRGGEMCVVVEGKSVVTDVDGAVACLHHGT